MVGHTEAEPHGILHSTPCQVFGVVFISAKALRYPHTRTVSSAMNNSQISAREVSGGTYDISKMWGDNYIISSKENNTPQEESGLEKSLWGKFILDGQWWYFTKEVTCQQLKSETGFKITIWLSASKMKSLEKSSFVTNVTKTNLQTCIHFHMTKIEPNREPKCLEESCIWESTSQGTNRPWPRSANQLNADLTTLWMPTWAGQRIIAAFGVGVHSSQELWGRFISCSEVVFFFLFQCLLLSSNSSHLLTLLMFFHSHFSPFCVLRVVPSTLRIILTHLETFLPLNA